MSSTAHYETAGSAPSIHQVVRRIAFLLPIAFLVALQGCESGHPLEPGDISPKVEDLNVAEATPTTVRLSFTDVGDGTGRLAYHAVHFSPGPGIRVGVNPVDSGTCAGSFPGTVPGRTIECTVAGLEPSTVYDFQLATFTESGEDETRVSRSNLARGKTPPRKNASPPGSVSDLEVETVTESSAHLVFTEVDDGAGGPARYEMRFSRSPMDSWSEAAIVTEGSCSRPIHGREVGALLACTVEALEASTTYEFRIAAYSGGNGNSAVYGEPSASVTATTDSGESAWTTVTVSPGASSILTDATVQLTATAADPSGTTATDASITWTSSDVAVATVSASGLVRGVAAGRATIRANAGDAWGEGEVEVTAPTPPDSNEPSGYSMVTDRPFDARDDAGWRYNTSSLFTIASDPTAPTSCCLAGQALYPAGRSGGSSPVTTWFGFAGRGHTELYVSYWLKLSDNWQGHSSGVNKVAFVWIHGDASVYFSAQGSGSGTLRPQIRLQAVPDGSHNLAWNVNNVSIERGKWHHWEVQLISNSGGEKNGVARLWIDGTLALDHRDVRYASASQSRTWESLYWAPVWGGMGDTVQNDMSMRMDHIYASGR